MTTCFSEKRSPCRKEDLGSRQRLRELQVSVLAVTFLRQYQIHFRLLGCVRILPQDCAERPSRREEALKRKECAPVDCPYHGRANCCHSQSHGFLIGCAAQCEHERFAVTGTRRRRLSETQHPACAFRKSPSAS